MPVAHFLEHGVELFRIIAPVVRWNTHPQDKCPGAKATGGRNDCSQVLGDQRNADAAQPVVRSQLHDDYNGLVALQQRLYAPLAASSRFTTDTGIDDRNVRVIVRQSLAQQVYPTTAGWQPVTGRQTVTDDEDGITTGRQRGADEQQYKDNS